MFQYVSAVINNEGLTILYSAVLCLYLVRRLRDQECTMRHAVALGLLIGGCTWIKQTTLFAAPLALWVVWMLGDREHRWQPLGAFAALSLGVGIWWPLHNVLVSGSPFPCYTIPPDQPGAEALLTQRAPVLEYFRMIAETAFLPDWSWTFLPRLLSTVVTLGGAAAVAGLFLHSLRAREPAWRRQAQWFAVAAIGFLMVGILQFCLLTDWRAQNGGRYLLNGLPWLVALIATTLPGTRLQPLLPVGAVLLVLFDAGWWLLVAAFYGKMGGTG
jgi:hypothetical protein